MDVKLPNGTVVRNVPEGTTRAQLMAKVGKAGMGGQVDRSGVAGTADAFMRGVSDFATFGLADKAVAGLNSVLPLDALTNPNVTSIWSGKSIGAAYRQNLKADRAISASDEANHSVARTLGQVGGALLVPVPGAGKIKAVSAGAGRLARAGRLAPFLRAAGEGAVQGGLYGAGSGDGSIMQRGGRALREGAAGAAGGVAGTVATKALGRLATGGGNASVRLLNKAGVTMTPGQMLGGVAKTMEDKIRGVVPVLGDVMAMGQRKSIGDSNLAVARGALKEIGTTLPKDLKPGREMVDFGQKAFDKAYDAARSGMQMQADEPFHAGLREVLDQADTGALAPQYADRLKKVVDNTVLRHLGPDGVMSGDTLKKVTSDLSGLASKASSGANNFEQQEFGDALHAVIDHIDDSARRHSDPAAVAAMDAADKGYAQWIRIEHAAASAGAKDGIFSPAQLGASVRKFDNSARGRRYAAGNALLQPFSDAAQKVLPSTVPDSGTAGRWLIGAPLTGGGAALTGSAIPLAAAGGAASLPYLPGLNRLTQKMLLDRPEVVRRAGEKLRRNARIGGIFGAPLAIKGASINE